MRHEHFQRIHFIAQLMLYPGTNLRIVPGGYRFSPTIRFHVPGLPFERFGTAIVTFSRAISSGEGQEASIEMVGDSDLDILVGRVTPGVAISLFQGPTEIGNGTILQVSPLEPRGAPKGTSDR
jgi:hypothetical protein